MKSARESVDHVRVCCRVRPLNTMEKQMYRDFCVDYPSHSNDTIEFRATAAASTGGDRKGEMIDSAALHRHSNNGGSSSSGGGGGGGAESCTFAFSHVFRPETGQADVYEHVARPIVADVISGYNGTIFAYGQTGSGKTHTMFGSMKGGAWGADGEETCSARPSAVLPAELAVGANEEEEQGEKEQDKEDYNAGGSEESGNEEEEEGENEEVVLRPSTAGAPSAASFCRSKAAVTPLCELRQVNVMQNAASAAADHKPVEKHDRAKVANSVLPARKLARAKMSKTQEVRQRSAFAKDTVSGVIPRAVHDIFHAISNADPSTEFDVQMFFVEVYMEQIHDLLIPASYSTGSSGSSRRPAARKLQLREDVSTNSFYIDGCRMPHVSSAREVLQMVKTGLRHRATSATAMNETSSRSHCLLNLTVKSVNHTRCVSTVGKLYLVDLAGSEKVGKTNATGLRLEEAKLINKSLSTLGMVIMSLTDKSTTYTPYRNSVLTKILKDSLGGNSHTALVICCSPSPYNAQETLSTLRFGARAKTVENKAIVNRELTAAQLKRMLDSAKDEIERLHSKIRQLTKSSSQTPPGHGSSSTGDNITTTASLYDSYAALIALSQETGQPDCGGGVACDFPVVATRKLSNASAASEAAHADTSEDTNRISTLLEERALEQARLQQLQAEVAQLQDSLNAAQETISTLQEERDGYLDKMQSYREEIQVWEAAHQDARHHAATQAALLQQCTVLLHTQSSEICDLTKTMEEYAAPLAQARAAISASTRTSDFDSDAPSQRRHTLITTDAALLPVPKISEPRADRLSGLSSGVPDGESPNPRRQLASELGDVSIVLPQTSRSQQLQGPHTRDVSGDSSNTGTEETRGPCSNAWIGLSPAQAAAQEWKSRHASLEEQADEQGRRSEGVMGAAEVYAAQAERIACLEAQLASLNEEHATLQQQHKDAQAELQSKRRILEMRQNRLDNMDNELKNEYAMNKELRERLEKEREAVRAPLEMARNDANYWRRRFEELSSRHISAGPARASENPRSSLRFALPSSSTSGDGGVGHGNATRCSGGLGLVGESGRRTLSGSALTSAAASKAAARLSFLHTPTRPTTSCRGSSDDVLLSLSSHSTPIRTRAPFPSLALPACASSTADTAKTTVAYAKEGEEPADAMARIASPLRPRSSSRSVSPSANSKL